MGRVLTDYQVGDRIVIDIDPSYHKAMPHRRFQGKVGRIVGTRGRAYVVEVYNGNKRKVVITTPEHIRPFRG